MHASRLLRLFHALTVGGLAPGSRRQADVPEHRDPLRLAVRMLGWAAYAALAVVGCDAGDVTLLAPGGNEAGTVVLIRATLDSPYATLARSLGWTAGVPGAQVRVHLMTDPYDSSYWHMGMADSVGVASFSTPPGLYETEVSRALSDGERRLAGGTVRLLAGGRRLHAQPNETADVAMQPDQPGSLVFGEIWEATPPDWYGTYNETTYFEIYDNSDTTIYLDRKYVGVAFSLDRDYAFTPCIQTEIARNDPEGIWTEYVWRIPGGGTDHPLAPGHQALIAKSALDHRVVLATLPDLRHADFEYGGLADNPNVPNLEDVGLRQMPGGDIILPPMFLSEPVDLASLPRYIEPHSGQAFVRIPRGQVLDAVGAVQDFTTTSYQARPSCLDAMHHSFERLPGFAWAWPVDYERGVSGQRRVLYLLPDGRQRLQDTNTSMFDFVKAPRTPGWIPDP